MSEESAEHLLDQSVLVGEPAIQRRRTHRSRIGDIAEGGRRSPLGGDLLCGSDDPFAVDGGVAAHRIPSCSCGTCRLGNESRAVAFSICERSTTRYAGGVMTVEEAKGSARVRLGHSEVTGGPGGLGVLGM